MMQLGSRIRAEEEHSVSAVASLVRLQKAALTGVRAAAMAKHVEADPYYEYLNKHGCKPDKSKPDGPARES
jgi:hypothetical protein